MTSKQRLLNAFRRLGPSDRPPFAPLMPEYWTDSLPPEIRKASHLELSKLMGGDAIIRINAYTVRYDDTVQVEQTSEGKFTRIRYTTPIGIVEELQENAPAAETIFKMEFVVKEERDFEVLEYIYDHTIFDDNREQVARAIEETGDDGLVLATIQGAPLVMLFRHREPSALLIDSYDRPDAVKHAADAIHRAHLRSFEIVRRTPAQVIISYCADLSASLISPGLYERYAMPYLSELAGILHAEDKLLVTHLCGFLKPMLPLLKQTGIDGICSLTQPPMGDTTVAMVREALGEDFPVIGILDPVVFALGKPEQIRLHVEQALAALPDTRGLIFAPADSTAAGTTMENLSEAARTIKDWFGRRRG